MTYKEEYDQLDARQLALRVEMENSDAHALKCMKRGTDFATEYPEEYEAYDAAVTEYNANEVRMAELVELMKEEEAESEESTEGTASEE
jgi:hypothetical protein